VREKFSDLVFETLACLIREREIVRVCASAENVRVDQLDRAFRVLRTCAAWDGHANERDACES
jgi:hypothetical protein